MRTQPELVLGNEQEVSLGRLERCCRRGSFALPLECEPGPLEPEILVPDGGPTHNGSRQAIDGRTEHGAAILAAAEAEGDFGGAHPSGEFRLSRVVERAGWGLAGAGLGSQTCECGVGLVEGETSLVDAAHRMGGIGIALGEGPAPAVLDLRDIAWVGGSTIAPAGPDERQQQQHQRSPTPLAHTAPKVATSFRGLPWFQYPPLHPGVKRESSGLIAAPRRPEHGVVLPVRRVAPTRDQPRSINRRGPGEPAIDQCAGLAHAALARRRRRRARPRAIIATIVTPTGDTGISLGRW